MVDNYLNQYLPSMHREEQITSSHCGPAVTKMLLNFLGASTTQLEITHAAGLNRTIIEEGAAIEDLAKAVFDLFPGRFQFWWKKNSELNDLVQLTNFYHYPVAVGWQGVFGEFSDGYDDHYAVATHVDESANVIYLADPYRAFAGQDRVMKLGLFENRWWSFAEMYDYKTGKFVEIEEQRVMFMITPRAEEFPALLGMHPGVPE